MKLLLDTCTFLWVCLDSGELTEAVRSAYQDPENQVYLSAVSCWEIAVKYRLGKLMLPDPPARFVPDRRKILGVDALPLSEKSALYVAQMPMLHRDPFDRMLVAQAVTEGMTIVSPDGLIEQYAVATLW